MSRKSCRSGRPAWLFSCVRRRQWRPNAVLAWRFHGARSCGKVSSPQTTEDGTHTDTTWTLRTGNGRWLDLVGSPGTVFRGQAGRPNEASAKKDKCQAQARTWLGGSPREPLEPRPWEGRRACGNQVCRSAERRHDILRSSVFPTVCRRIVRRRLCARLSISSSATQPNPPLPAAVIIWPVALAFQRFPFVSLVPFSAVVEPSRSNKEVIRLRPRMGRSACVSRQCRLARDK
jgi:hypothetical protein